MIWRVLDGIVWRPKKIMIKHMLRMALRNFPSAAQFLRNSRDLLDRHSLPKVTPWGFTLAGHEAMAAGLFEPEETAVVRNLLKEVDVLVNVGANVGYYCCHALSLGKKVIAVEPIARNLHYLLANIRDNGWAEDAEVFPVAVGPNATILKMWGGGTGASLIKGWASIPENYVTHVPILTLDRLLGDALCGKRSLMLVDIEGAEYMMLQGAFNTLLNEPRPIWMVEISATEHQPGDVGINPKFKQTFEVFFKHGYRAFTANLEQASVGVETIDDIIAGKCKLETHNFIFK